MRSTPSLGVLGNDDILRKERVQVRGHLLLLFANHMLFI